MSIGVIGKISIDKIQTSFGQLDEVEGGEAIYFARTSSILKKTDIISIVGYDYEPKIKQYLKEHKISYDYIKPIEKQEHYKKDILYDDLDIYKPHTIEYNKELYENNEIDIPDKIDDYSHIYLGELNTKTYLKLIEKRKNKNQKYLINYSLIESERNKKDYDKLLKKADIIIIKDSDLIKYSGETNIISGVKKLVSKKSSVYTIVKSNFQSVLLSKDSLVILPAYPVERIVDYTGSLYSFAGGLLSYLDYYDIYDWESFVEGCAYANIVSSFCIEGFGTNGFINININRIIGRFEEYKIYTSYPDVNKRLMEKE